MCCEVPPYGCKSMSKRRERRSKTMTKWGRNVGKNLRLCSGSRGIRKWWAKASGAPGKGPSKIENLIFGKSIGKCVCCEVPPYRCKSKSKRRERRSKTMKKGGRNVGKIGGYVEGVWEFENGGQKPLGPRENAPQKFENLILEKV